MRKLHLVGYTPDLEGLIFTARRGSKSGGYVVAIEDGLVDTIDEARRRRNGDAPASELSSKTRDAAGSAPSRPASTLTPREIQARLRSGRSIAQVAAEARVDPDWVERFAVPILAEQAQIVELAKASTYSKPRLGPSTQTLGASVAWNLADRGILFPDDVLATAWTAHQVHDTLWRVRLAYRSRGRSQEAIWELDVPTAQLVARNRLASELAHIEKGRRRRSVSRLNAAGGDAEVDDEQTVATPPRKRSRRPAKRSVARKPARRKPTARTTAAVKTGKTGSAAKARRAPTARARTAPKVTKASKASKASKATRAKTAPAKARSTSVAKRGKAATTRKAARAGAVKPSTGSGPRKATTKRSVKASAIATQPEPVRTTNRVAASKVAASRAVANRLTGDRVVGNTVAPEPPGFLSREVSRRPPPPEIASNPKVATTSSARSSDAAAKTNARQNAAQAMDIDSLLDDTPAPPMPPVARSLNRRTARPARAPFGVRPSPAPAG